MEVSINGGFRKCWCPNSWMADFMNPSINGELGPTPIRGNLHTVTSNH